MRDVTWMTIWQSVGNYNSPVLLVEMDWNDITGTQDVPPDPNVVILQGIITEQQRDAIDPLDILIDEAYVEA